MKLCVPCIRLALLYATSVSKFTTQCVKWCTRQHFIAFKFFYSLAIIFQFVNLNINEPYSKWQLSTKCYINHSTCFYKVNIIIIVLSSLLQEKINKFERIAYFSKAHLKKITQKPRRITEDNGKFMIDWLIDWLHAISRPSGLRAAQRSMFWHFIKVI